MSLKLNKGIKKLNRWELKALAVKCEIALELNYNNLSNINSNITYDTIDYIIENLKMSTFESAVLNDHITLLKAFLNLNNKNDIFESAYQFYYLYNRLK